MYSGNDRVADSEMTRRFAAELSPSRTKVVLFREYAHELINESSEALQAISVLTQAWVLEHATKEG